MNKFSFLSLPLLALLLSACAQQVELTEETEERIYPDFVASAPRLRVLDDRWEAGDQIGIFSSREIDVPYVTTHGDGAFAPRSDRRISMAPEGETFHAYYPYSYGGGGSVSFDLRDQCALLYGEGKGVKGETQVELSFSHRLSQIRVRLVSEIEGLDLSDATVELLGYRTGGLMDKRSGAITAGEAVEPLSAVRYGDTFVSYILPGETLGDPSHKIQIGVGSKMITLDEPAFEQVTRSESGIYYSLILHLKQSTPEVSSGGFSASIRSFVEGGRIEGDIYLDDPTVGDGERTILEEHFDTSLGQMSSHTVIGTGIDFRAEEGCATVSSEGMGITKILLLSPSLDFTSVSDARLSFAHSIINGKSMQEQQTLFVTTEDFPLDDPEAARWQQVTIPNYPSAMSKDFVPNSISLPDFVYGQANVHFAFVYTSKGYESVRWRIDDLLLRVTDSGSVEDTPDPGRDPGDAKWLFDGADCESETDFRAALGKQGLRSYAVISRDHAYPARGQVLSVVKRLNGNEYLLSFKGAIPSGTETISFLLRGVSSARSMSVNVYSDQVGANGQQSYVCYNLGEVGSRDVVLQPEPRNLYKGTINTCGQWIKVSLDVRSVGLSSQRGGESLAIKLGGASDIDLMLDDFCFR